MLEKAIKKLYTHSNLTKPHDTEQGFCLVSIGYSEREFGHTTPH
jgi:hypothetical protein